MIDIILDRASPKTIAIAVFAIFVLVKLTQRLNKERKIRALGGHAPRIPTWLPFGKFSSLNSA